MKLGLYKGKFSVLRLYAHPDIRRKYPIHSALALVIYGAVHNEADCERVFVFSGKWHIHQHTPPSADSCAPVSA